jgi:hypothetical protein
MTRASGQLPGAGQAGPSRARSGMASGPFRRRPASGVAPPGRFRRGPSPGITGAALPRALPARPLPGHYRRGPLPDLPARPHPGASSAALPDITGAAPPGRFQRGPSPGITGAAPPRAIPGTARWVPRGADPAGRLPARRCGQRHARARAYALPGYRRGRGWSTRAAWQDAGMANDPLSRLSATAAASEATGPQRVLHPRDCGPDPLIDFAFTATALAALRLLERNPGLPRRAQNIACQLAASGVGFGLDVSPPGGAMVNVLLGEPSLALTAQRICAGHGLRARCFRSPSVPPGGSRLRLTARASLTGDDVPAATQAPAAVRDHVRTASPAGRK